MMDSFDRATTVPTLRDVAWRTARSCGPNGGNCVEVNRGTRGLVGLRDSKPAAGPALVFGTGDWNEFLRSVKSGRLDRG